MRCIGLRLLNCRLWQTAWLALVLMPTAAMSHCAAADQSAGNGQHPILAASADRLHDSLRIDGDCDRENPRLSTAHRRLSGAGCPSGDQGVGVVPKAAWPAGKSHVSRRGGERWPVASLGSIAALPPRLTASVSPMPKSSSVLSAEYALLRRLEL
jgi:hypothetical protein